jgi:hypothetical protein
MYHVPGTSWGKIAYIRANYMRQGAGQNVLSLSSPL